jgi:hypothetical protein
MAGRRARLLGEQAADPADRHPEGDRRREEVAGAQPVAGQALRDVHARPRTEQAAQDAAVAVEPLLGDRRVLAQVDVLQPGAHPHQDRATDERTHDHEDQPLVASTAPARLQHEHDRRGEHAEPHEEAVGRDRPEERVHGRQDCTGRGVPGRSCRRGAPC